MGSISAKLEAVCIMMLHIISLRMHSIQNSPSSLVADIVKLPAAQRSE